jgi:CBS domain-containing protein
MRIADILRHKGSDVVTIPADGTVRELLARLADHEIGALVVVDGDPSESPDAGAVLGIVTERDVVRQLNQQGDALLDAEVGSIMTTDVIACRPEDDVDRIAETMTARRVRHMPVLTAGRLSGLVSIGDVVKSRIEQLEHDRGALEHYISG